VKFRDQAPPLAAALCAGMALAWIGGGPRGPAHVQEATAREQGPTALEQRATPHEQGATPREHGPLALTRVRPRRLEAAAVTAVELAFRGATRGPATAAVAWDLFDGKRHVGSDRCTAPIVEAREGQPRSTVLFDLREAPPATRAIARIGAVGPALEPLSDVVEVELAIVGAPDHPEAPSH
jgi:hypothetical protein